MLLAEGGGGAWACCGGEGGVQNCHCEPETNLAMPLRARTGDGAIGSKRQGSLGARGLPRTAPRTRNPASRQAARFEAP